MVNTLQKGFNHVGLRKHSLMLLFGTFVLALLTYIDHHKK
ncbi:putative holin-like toxin [Lactobacillus gasseri]